VTFFITSLGQAYQDSYSNTFVANVPGAHRWLGFIHAMYMLGCLVGPFIATPIASDTKWYYTYAVEAGLGALNIGFVYAAFGTGVSAERKRRREKARDAETQTRPVAAAAPTAEIFESGDLKASEKIRRTLKLRAVWLISLFYFFYLGAALTASGE
jgi:fucose permease